jgi:hypothetical protein
MLNLANATIVESTDHLVSADTIAKDFKNSGRTSIFRSSASAPLKFLIKKGWITGSVLNYGKGRCSVDSDTIKSLGLQCSDYDYTFAYYPEVLGSSFTTVYAGYVTNTLPLRSREVVWGEVARATRKNGGFAFIAARSDKDKGIKGVAFEDGVVTSIGTFQKGYKEGELLTEALKHFAFAAEVDGCPSGFRIVMCSHSTWS